MAQQVTPSTLQRQLSRHQPMVVEYYHDSRDPVVAHAVDKAAHWMTHHAEFQRVPVYRVNIKHHAAALDKMGVRILPQPSTVAIYGQNDVEMYRGRLDSSKQLVARIRAGGAAGSGSAALASAMRSFREGLAHLREAGAAPGPFDTQVSDHPFAAAEGGQEALGQMQREIRAAADQVSAMRSAQSPPPRGGGAHDPVGALANYVFGA